MDIKNFETFIQVADQNSLTKAAKKLGYTQSAVSAQIKQLEHAYGVLLFERVNHTVKLTPKGEQILQLAQKLLATVEDIENTASSKKDINGKVRIAMCDSLCHWLFWDNFDHFHNTYPNISLKIFPASTEEMFRLANQNDVDLIFTLDKHIYDSNYTIVKEHKVKTHFIMGNENPLFKKYKITIEDVLEQPFILTEKGMSYRQRLDDYLAKESMEINPFLEIGDTELICHLVEKNMGISYLPDFITDEYVAKGKVKQFEVDTISDEIWIQMLYHKSKWITPAMQTVMDYICSIL